MSLSGAFLDSALERGILLEHLNVGILAVTDLVASDRVNRSIGLDPCGHDLSTFQTPDRRAIRVLLIRHADPRD